MHRQGNVSRPFKNGTRHPYSLNAELLWQTKRNWDEKFSAFPTFWLSEKLTCRNVTARTLLSSSLLDVVSFRSRVFFVQSIQILARDINNQRSYYNFREKSFYADFFSIIFRLLCQYVLSWKKYFVTSRTLEIWYSIFVEPQYSKLLRSLRLPFKLSSWIAESNFNKFSLKNLNELFRSLRSCSKATRND